MDFAPFVSIKSKTERYWVSMKNLRNLRKAKKKCQVASKLHFCVLITS